MTSKIIDYGTGSAISSEFSINGDTREVTIFCGPNADLSGSNSLGAGESIKFQIKSSDGKWFDLYAGGAVKQLDEDNNIETVYGPGIFRVVKSATTAAVGVFMDRKLI